ncbi:MAG: hypothetical protein CMM50_03570 [Rhodospirillaceae bacterium]|nr:hypothetical protein [Rhodospirillaceae bacterium]|tara:strand:- start:86 stop:430 length:345 start_codon:yes stop_codon:yes gene_type:complete
MSYIGAHWSGRQSLLVSTAVNMVLGYIIVLLIGFGLSIILPDWITEHPVVTIIAAIAFLAWFLWALVGTARCAIRVIRTREKAMWERVAGSVALLGVVAIATITASDASRLLGG